MRIVVNVDVVNDGGIVFELTETSSDEGAMKMLLSAERSPPLESEWHRLHHLSMSDQESRIFNVTTVKKGVRDELSGTDQTLDWSNIGRLASGGVWYSGNHAYC